MVNLEKWGKMGDQVNKESRANKESLDHPDHLGSGEFLDLKGTEGRPDFQGKRERMESLGHRAVKANPAKRVPKGFLDSRE